MLNNLIERLAKEAAYMLVAVKSAGSFVPKPPPTSKGIVHPPLPGKATGQTNAFPAQGSTVPASPNFASGLQNLKIPKGFNIGSPEIDKMVASNYTGAGPRITSDGRGYYPNARVRNFLATYNNVQSPDQQEAMRLESRRLANLGIRNRAAVPITYDYSTDRSYATNNLWLPPVPVRDGELVSVPSSYSSIELERNSPRHGPSPGTEDWGGGRIGPDLPRGALMAHELEHAGAQRPQTVDERVRDINQQNLSSGKPAITAEQFLGNYLNGNPIAWFKGREYAADQVKNDLQTYRPKNDNPALFKAEMPAVMAELANSAQSAYVAKGNQPLTGHMSIDPTGRFKVPLEEFRKQVVARGHVGGEHNVSMTDLMNSPEGQEFLRMNMQNAKIKAVRDAQRAERVKGLTHPTMLPGDITWGAYNDRIKRGPDIEEKEMINWR